MSQHQHPLLQISAALKLTRLILLFLVITMIQTLVLPSRRNAIDYHAFGVPRDHWHDGKRAQVVNPKPDHLFALWFHKKSSSATPDPSIGVAFTQAEYGGDGVEFKASHMSNLLPENILAMGKDATLSFDWPGYAHLRYKAIINMDTTLGDLSAQIVCVFRHFYEKYHQSFQGPGVRLGPSHVCFEQLRLRNIFFDGRVWHIEASYVHDG